MFERALRQLPLTPPIRKAVAALAPGALGPQPSPCWSFEAYREQVAYHGRRLAKLDAPAVGMARAIDEYVRLLREALPAPEKESGRELHLAADLWRLWITLSLNRAFHEVAEAEARTYHRLFQAELESRTLEELLGRMLEALAEYAQAERSAVFWLDRSAQSWKVLHALPEGAGPGTIPLAASSVPRFRRPRCQLVGRPGPRLAILPQWHRPEYTVWSVPLLAEGRFSGVMQFAFPKAYPWLPRERRLLETAAEHCSLAAEKARLTQRLAEKEDQVRRLAERLVEVEERERKRISSELHDEAGQALMCIRLELEMLEQKLPPEAAHLAPALASARSLTEHTITEIRRVISSLSPAALSQLGLPAAIRQLAARTQQLTGIRIRLKIGPLPQLPPPVQTAIYRLVQESLHNATRHSSASTIKLSLKAADRQISLNVEDDGVGFDVPAALAKPNAFGLTGMKERAALLGGEFQVRSQAGKGTRIEVRLPDPTRRM
ncbi:MAG: GAF domain-containing sensor histidine kinase [Bryobacteraceae bacterium]|nr:GAF domain-containing sensor histidine kinase [Bryobacteraceae bacterium]